MFSSILILSAGIRSPPGKGDFREFHTEISRSIWMYRITGEKTREIEADDPRLAPSLFTAMPSFFRQSLPNRSMQIVYFLWADGMCVPRLSTGATRF